MQKTDLFYHLFMEHLITETEVSQFLSHVRELVSETSLSKSLTWIFILQTVAEQRFTGRVATAETLVAVTSELILDIERETHSSIAFVVTPDKFLMLWKHLPYTFLAAMQNYINQPVQFAGDCAMM